MLCALMHVLSHIDQIGLDVAAARPMTVHLADSQRTVTVEHDQGQSGELFACWAAIAE